MPVCMHVIFKKKKNHEIYFILSNFLFNILRNKNSEEEEKKNNNKNKSKYEHTCN